jgi:hypothetical protein
MDISNILIFLFEIVLLAVAAAAFINGIFITTRGETIIGPDGEKRDVDAMIFYPLYKLICKRNVRDEVVYYTDKRLEILLGRIHKAFPALSDKNYRIDTDSIYFDDLDIGLAWQHPMLMQWYDHNDIHVQFFEHKIMFSAHYPRYILPAIIRKPLVQCVKCMASFWGSLVWWCTVLPATGWHPQWQLPLWIAFCFMTSYLATLLHKKSTT